MNTKNRIHRKEYLERRRKKRGDALVIEENFKEPEVKSINDIVQCLILIDERQRRMSKDLEAIRGKLYGDGREGLAEEMIVIKTTLKNIKYGMAIGFSVTTVLIGLLKYLII